MTLPTEDELSLLFSKTLEEFEKCKIRTNDCLRLHQTIAGIMKKKDGKPPTFGMTKRPLDPKIIELTYEDALIKAKELGLIEK